MESKIVIFQKEILRNRDMTWGLQWLDHLSIQNATTVLFLPCNFSKKTSRSQEDFSFVCLFNLIGGNYFTILCWFLTYINMNWPQVYMCPLLPEHPLHLPLYSVYPSCPRTLPFGALLNASIWTGHVSYIWPWHISMLFSQIILLLPSPTEYKGLFFTSMSLLLPCM